MQTEFDSLNQNKICSRLNKFGLTGHDHCHRHNPKIKITDDNIALKIAVNTLIQNKKFTNVTDSLILINCGVDICYVSDDSTHWGVHFGQQKYKDYNVMITKINVALYGDGVFNIDGYWFQDVYIPPIDKINKNVAKDKILGEKIIWYDFGGNPKEFIVTRESIIDNIEKVIFPLENENSIELRVVWKIPISFGSFIGWHIYLDTTQNEIVAIIQEFIT